MDHKAPYSLVWQKCEENSPLAERFHVPGFVGFLPFFISGADQERLENQEEIELREEQLLKGILFGLHDYENEDNFWYQEDAKNTYKYLLEVLGRGFRFEGPEALILSTAADVRNKNGINASSIILRSGHALMPFSSPIMSDLITDTWMILALEKSDEFREEGLQRIVDLVHQIDMERLIPEAREVIAYFGLTALITLGWTDKVDEYRSRFIDPYVINHQLLTRIEEMLLDPTRAKIEAF